MSHQEDTNRHMGVGAHALDLDIKLHIASFLSDSCVLTRLIVCNQEWYHDILEWRKFNHEFKCPFYILLLFYREQRKNMKIPKLTHMFVRDIDDDTMMIEFPYITNLTVWDVKENFITNFPKSVEKLTITSTIKYHNDLKGLKTLIGLKKLVFDCDVYLDVFCHLSNGLLMMVSSLGDDISQSTPQIDGYNSIGLRNAVRNDTFWELLPPNLEVVEFRRYYDTNIYSRNITMYYATINGKKLQVIIR